MRKRHFILIGISVILLAIGSYTPFIGIGENGINITNIPLSIFLSLFMFLIGLKGLYKDTKKYDFKNGFILSIVGLCVILLVTLFSPLIAGGEFIGPFKYLSLVVEAENSEYLLFVYTNQFFKSFRAIFIVTLLGLIFYTIAASKFVNGIRYLSVDRDHKNNLKKAFKKFNIVNILLIILAIIMMTIFIRMFELISFYSYSGYLLPLQGIELILYLLLLYLVILPGSMVLSVFYYINLIKSIIYIFKTPSHFIEEKSDVIELNDEV